VYKRKNITKVLIVVFERGKPMKEINENEIMNFDIDDFRDLTSQETQQDNFRRLFQMLGLIHKNQIEIKELLTLEKHSQSSTV
jgi:hypothetical protein